MPDTSKLHFDIPKVDNEKTEMLTDTQISAYFEALNKEKDQNLASLFRLALVTGMRKSALLNLQWDDCDFINRIIVLRGEVAKKGKTERIPMNDTSFKILQSIDKTNNPYVFPGKDGGPRKELRRMAQRVKKEAGLPEDFRPLHGLRHAFASHLISSGKVSLYELQKLLTHSSSKMTQRYAHLADEALRKAASVADNVFQTNKKDSTS
ncbi:MAG: site-specific integrase [Desulfovibrio sp.]|nr:site-specific integrase [Desulfovibrio sp.]